MHSIRPLPEIDKTHASFTTTFLFSLSHTSSPTKSKTDALCHALWLDECKPRQEVVTAEIGVIGRALRGAEELESWEAWKARVEKKAKGVVLIISPWSYPIILTFQALCGAIAAGCCAHKTLRSLTDILQASRRTHTERNTSILLRIASHWAVFRRSRRSSSSNGPTRSAAAAKHLTPMTLELGGNIPVIIDGRDLGGVICLWVGLGFELGWLL
ncbi:hypothetical protein D9611_015137 [Ephemerocybe angulata]|uniref:Aldehyde dehydrogenase domain-containing protein n=1 Tax=Ephemerocybe angulata TaxID=980116 RepID=A0A8H5B779_9AGAR|nr:hypothetical protein D9611_015137 [Tulosesus angulatus]